MKQTVPFPRRVLCALIVVVLVFATDWAPAQTSELPSVPAVTETKPVRGDGDSGDDMAIWLHPTDLSKSTVIGTDSKNGLMVYDLAGNELFFHEIGATGMVDLRYNFPLDGEQVALLAAGHEASNSIKLYRVDSSTRDLVEVSARAIEPGLTIYGTCMYHSRKTGEYYVFVTSQQGEVEQWRLFEGQGGTVDAERVRRFTLNPEGPNPDYTIEGCVADDQLGRLYLSQENAGRIWRVGAAPDDPAGNPMLIDKPQSEGGHTVADVEGLALYHRQDGTGYLVANNQGNHTYTVYSRDGANEYLMTYEIVESDSVDAVQSDDSIEITSVGLNSVFQSGMIVVEDGQNTAPGSAGNNNYKFVRWGDLANLPASPLTTDGFWNPRKADPGQ